ncbi:MAG TPA: baseplate J/gp47 family protein, partial [Ktedonobacteraceae bacterium]|nr:baseplate J/gp47 family protein [Ktedonobacteraceae bacterium]
MSQYSNQPEQSGPAGSYGPGTGSLPPADRHRRRRRVAIIAALIAILLLVLLLFFFFPRPTATVTLTPVNKLLSGSVTGSYAPRELSSTQQGSGSGVVIKPGAQATGTLTFKNYTPSWVTVLKGTVITNVTGQRVVTEKTIHIPPDPIYPGVACVSAQAAKVGKSGNITALSINKLYVQGVYVLNASVFSGGRDDQPGDILRQGDIDRVAKLEVASLTQQELSGLKGQLHPGEQLFKPTPTCSSPLVTSNPGVGASAAKFTVSVSLTCSDSAYDPQTVPSQEEEMLKQQAAQQLHSDPGFMLDGNIAIQIEQETPDKNGEVDVRASASETEKYHFTADQKLNMAKL